MSIRPRIAVLVFPGSNDDRDNLRVTEKLLGDEAVALWHKDRDLRACDAIILPGGFSYGDYLRCGAIAGVSPILDAIGQHARAGGVVVGICNGFQILCEAGLLPGALIRNRQLRFVCRDVHLKIERSDTPFTRGYNAGQVIRVPVAHGEGNYFAAEGTIGRLEVEGRVLFRYTDAEGKRDPKWNVNGATNSIAGVLNEKLNVLGLMPHPENHVETAVGCTDGRGLFAGLVAHFAQAA